MTDRLSRRQFAKLLALAGGAGAVYRDAGLLWPATGAQEPAWPDLPTFDGVFMRDEASRKTAAVDTGNLFHRVPAAVLRPGSVQDVGKLVKYANERSLKIAIKGHGHSKYGQ